MRGGDWVDEELEVGVASRRFFFFLLSAFGFVFHLFPRLLLSCITTSLALLSLLDLFYETGSTLF